MTLDDLPTIRPDTLRHAPPSPKVRSEKGNLPSTPAKMRSVPCTQSHTGSTKFWKK